MQTNIIGRGSIKEIKNILQNINAKKILIFRGKKSFEQIKDKIEPFLMDFDNTFYADIAVNPKYEQVISIVDAYSDKIFDAIVAIGGGSVIDFAKAYKYYGKIEKPLIAVPTTAGTGSEATQFAVIYKNGEKLSLDNANILPDFAIADSQFVENAPRYLKACSAIDAYCQAIESFWAKNATEESRKYAIKAIQLCSKFLVKAVTTKDVTACEKMSKAANFSGKAINISRTTAAHALSYKITSLYNIPHGHAVALTIAKLFEKNSGYYENENLLLKTIGIKKNQIQEYFHNLFKTINLKDNLKELCIDDTETIANSVNIERLKNNPRDLTKKDLLEILGVIND